MQLHAKYQVTICNRWKVMVNVEVARSLNSIWHLTLKNDLDLDMSPIKLCILVRWIHMPNIKLLSAIGEKLWPMLKLHVFDLQFDLEVGPWHWHVIHQIVRLSEINSLAKYQVAICNRSRWKVMANVKVAHFLTSIWPLTLKNDLDLDMSPIKLSVLVRWVHMQNMKLLSAIGGKLWPKLKLLVFYL